LPEIARWQTVLSDIELKIQGFDLGRLVGQLRASVSPPDEISGFVEKTGGTVRASVNWPGRTMANGAVMEAPFETGQLSGEASAALAIAASIVWAQAANAEPGFAKIPRQVFVAWALTWWDYRQIRAREALGEELSDEDKKRWLQARRLVDSLIGQAAKYPEIWRLRADIIDAAFNGVVSDRDKEIARADRQQYETAMGVSFGTISANASVHGAPTVRQAPRPQPSLPIWARSASKTPDAPFTVSMTVTAIVVDSSGKRSLLLPAYAIFDRSGDGETEFAMTPVGPVVARASKRDIIYNTASGSRDEAGVLLATLEQNAAADNILAGRTLTEIARIPAKGATIKLFSSGQSKKAGPVTKTGVIQDIVGPFMVTDGRVTENGDGGAPVLDENGALVGMGYIGTSSESRLLSVNWVVEQMRIKLAPLPASGPN
jgi:hypothetical protein